MVQLDEEIIDSIHFNAKDKKSLMYEESPDVWLHVLKVEVEPSILQDPTMVGMTSWQVINYKSTEIGIQMIFENPLYISYEVEPDTLVITFADPDLFISTDGIQIKDEYRVLKRKLQR